MAPAASRPEAPPNLRCSGAQSGGDGAPGSRPNGRPAAPRHPQQILGREHLDLVAAEGREQRDEPDGVVPAAELVDGQGVIVLQAPPGVADALPGVVGALAATASESPVAGATTRPVPFQTIRSRFGDLCPPANATHGFG